MRRRDFVAALVAGGVGTGLPSGRARRAPAARAGTAEAGADPAGERERAPAGAAPGEAAPPDLLPGVQLYTVRALMAREVPATLDVLARIGYREVELAGLWGRSPGEMRSLLDAAGLSAPSGHETLARVRNEWTAALDEAATLGQRWIVCAWLGEEERTPDGYRRVADDFNAAGEAARGTGIGLAYHNHDYEFAQLGDGSVGYDLLLDRCDPELVRMQMDLFWTVNGGRDPLAYLRAHPGRFVSVHVKDRTTSGEMVDVGRGAIDFRRIFARADEAGIRHAFVEHDEPDDPVESVRASYAALVDILKGDPGGAR